MSRVSEKQSRGSVKLWLSAFCEKLSWSSAVDVQSYDRAQSLESAERKICEEEMWRSAVNEVASGNDCE